MIFKKKRKHSIHFTKKSEAGRASASTDIMTCMRVLCLVSFAGFSAEKDTKQTEARHLSSQVSLSSSSPWVTSVGFVTEAFGMDIHYWFLLRERERESHLTALDEI